MTTVKGQLAAREVWRASRRDWRTTGETAHEVGGQSLYPLASLVEVPLTLQQTQCAPEEVLRVLPPSPAYNGGECRQVRTQAMTLPGVGPGHPASAADQLAQLTEVIAKELVSLHRAPAVAVL